MRGTGKTDADLQTIPFVVGLHATPVLYPHFRLELSGPDKLKQVVMSSHNLKKDRGSRRHARRASPSVTCGGALCELCPCTQAQQPEGGYCTDLAQ